MLHLMSDKKGVVMHSSSPREVLVFTPTPNEYKGVSRYLGQSVFKNFTTTVVECGPGKINATFKLSAEIMPRLNRGHKPAFVVGSGTSGSLSLGLREGEVIASSSVTISDWKMEDGRDLHFSPYGRFNYKPIAPAVAEEIALTCHDLTVKKLMDELGAQGFKVGRMMSSDTFVAGMDNKLNSGRKFNCLACDMESGAFAFTAQHLLGGIPWFNVRVVADTLDESLADYFNKEVDMVEILGKKTADALTALDKLLD